MNTPKEIFTPTTLTAKIDSCFRKEFQRIYVEGEISGRFRQGGGHVYFYLNDNRSKLKAIIWKSNPTKAGSLAEDGLYVLAKGYLTTYYARSEYQLIVESMEPKGEGALRLAYEKLKARLQAEGIFEPERKRKLPFWPQKVALLTSLKGAAIEDFIKTALKRCPQAAISVYPVKVQGEGAALEMANAISDINNWGGFDLIVLTRGGGSLEDLWAYNEEVLVRAVANSRTRTFAAIGHATDLSLTEMATDGAAITPTSAAETIFPDTLRLKEDVLDLMKDAVRAVADKFSNLNKEIDSLRARLMTFQHRLHQESLHLNSQTDKLKILIRQQISRVKESLLSVWEKLIYVSPRNHLKRQKEELTGLETQLEAIKNNLMQPFRMNLNHTVDRLQLISPLGVLTRGYALTMDEKGKLLTKITDFKEGDSFILRLNNGTLRAKVEKILTLIFTDLETQ
ncbi:MAG: exodeoxyribonuclease VII large subunit [Deltaproteobacteria bacterium]|jgi:exodeoxyribonuclease VII large subunit|nr:exodeoxyribonuclease VII large subunit [Deltaproteobacteria bacterium]